MTARTPGRAHVSSAPKSRPSGRSTRRGRRWGGRRPGKRRKPRFALVPIEGLRAHEQADERMVEKLAREIARKKLFVDPIWIDRATRTILNGHHRFHAVKHLGARRIPAYLFEYRDDPSITLGRWDAGPPISKEEVLRAAKEGRLFPIKTTRHRVRELPPTRPVPIGELIRADIEEARPPAAIRRRASVQR